MAIGSTHYNQMMRHILEHYDRKGWFERIDISVSPEFIGFVIHVRYHDGYQAVCKIHTENIDDLKKKIEEMSWRPYDPSKPQATPTQGRRYYDAFVQARPSQITGITSV